MAAVFPWAGHAEVHGSGYERRSDSSGSTPHFASGSREVLIKAISHHYHLLRNGPATYRAPPTNLHFAPHLPFLEPNCSSTAHH
jgi:hypothetical protein